MILKSPFLITSRLMPGVRIAGASISIAISDKPGDGPEAAGRRVRYRYAIDLGKESLEADDLQTGRYVGSSLQQGMSDLLYCLSYYGHEYKDGPEQDQSADYDPPKDWPLWLMQWAADNHEELDTLATELEGAGPLISDERVSKGKRK